jgi:hypothetical protein
MATTPAQPGFGNNMGTMYAIGGVGQAISAGAQANANAAMRSLQTDQLKQRIAFERVTLEKQIALRDQEIQRQQMYAKAVADAVDASKGQYSDVNTDIGNKQSSIADAFQTALDHQPTNSIVPQAMAGAVADKEAAMRALASGDASRNANNLANVQSLGEVFTDKGRALNRNNQVSNMLRNFAQGSGQATNAQIGAAEGKFMERPQVQMQPSSIGDLFVAGSMAGMGMLNQNKANQQTSTIPGGLAPDYSLSFPSSGSGLGLRMPGSAANPLGIK